MTSSGPEQTPSPAPGGLRRADVGVAAGALLSLVAALLPWYRVGGFDLGQGYRFPAVSVNGFDSGLVVLAVVLLLGAAGWALLPTIADVPVPFPRALLTTGLATLAFLLTLVEWLSDLDIGFSATGLLAVLSALAVVGCAALRLTVDLRDGQPVPRGLAGAVAWAGRPAPRSRRGRADRQLPAGPPATDDVPGDRPAGGRT